MTFYLSANPDAFPSDPIKTGTVQATGGSLQTMTRTVPSVNRSDMVWTVEQYNFTATGTQHESRGFARFFSPVAKN